MRGRTFIAFDLGATSGRSVVGTIAEGKLALRELTRFPNSILNVQGRCYWDILALYGHIEEGLKRCKAEGIEPESIGIDTWGVDFVLIGGDGQLMGQPRAYRDPHTEGVPEEFFSKVMPRGELYRKTGIQVMNFNSLYQLYAMQRDGDSLLASARHALFIPDALNYMLTGRMATEYTIASTSQILDPRSRRMDTELLRKIGVREDLFPDVIESGKVVGHLNDDIASRTGLGKIPVVAVAGHDTASAVAAIPARNINFAYLSSGTWSLMGIEVKEPVINEDTERFNITNEGGIDGTTRLLKNITGMWIIEQCLMRWKAEGADYSYDKMVEMASSAAPFVAFIDPDDRLFAAPKSMLEAINEFLCRTGQSALNDHAQIIRVVFESLALKYRFVFDRFKMLADFPINTLHIIGGGARNGLLNQFTANALGIRVVAGPTEATAIGNIMIQARAAGVVGNLSDMRMVIARSVETNEFTPVDYSRWNEQYEKIISKNLKK